MGVWIKQRWQKDGFVIGVGEPDRRFLSRFRDRLVWQSWQHLDQQPRLDPVGNIRPIRNFFDGGFPRGVSASKENRRETMDGNNVSG